MRRPAGQNRAFKGRKMLAFYIAPYRLLRRRLLLVLGFFPDGRLGQLDRLVAGRFAFLYGGAALEAFHGRKSPPAFGSRYASAS